MMTYLNLLKTAQGKRLGRGESRHGREHDDAVQDLHDCCACVLELNEKIEERVVFA